MAVNSIKMEDMEREEDIIAAMDNMAKIFENIEDLSDLCKITDNGDNNILHHAVKKSLAKLLSYTLDIVEDGAELFNKDGYNALHLAVRLNNRPMVSCILKKKFDVDKGMSNGETALHIAAQHEYADILGDLVRTGGDLSVRDDEDWHTPLHDCLQEVFFESGDQSKFISIWNKVVEEAVIWWCSKQPKAAEPASGSPEYLEMQLKAVYYLRSCIKNKNGLSVLQFAADRGLVTCVQAMLCTKDVFVRLDTKSHKPNTYEIDITNLCPEYFPQEVNLFSEDELENLKDSKKDKDSKVNSLLEALSAVKPPNKAGEILESIPMRSLTRLEWRIARGIHFLWIIWHLTLMLLRTIQVHSPGFHTVSDVAIFVAPIYASILTVSHLVVKIKRRWRHTKRIQTGVEVSIREYEKRSGGIIVSILLTILKLPLDESVLMIEASFTGFSWAVLVLKIMGRDVSLTHPAVGGFCLLFGWLMLLIPLTSCFSPVYKLIAVLKYIVMRDMVPWFAIYAVITTGFAAAIELQFEPLVVPSSCVEDQPDLAGFLRSTGHTLFELLIMTSGLDTDLKHVRGVSCLFQYNSISVFVILFLVTLYAVISAVVLLNMLIAIMSNTVTEAQQDKGWRQYKVRSNVCPRTNESDRTPEIRTIIARRKYFHQYHFCKKKKKFAKTNSGTQIPSCNCFALFAD